MLTIVLHIVVAGESQVLQINFERLGKIMKVIGSNGDQRHFQFLGF